MSIAATFEYGRRLLRRIIVAGAVAAAIAAAIASVPDARATVLTDATFSACAGNVCTSSLGSVSNAYGNVTEFASMSGGASPSVFVSGSSLTPSVDGASGGSAYVTYWFSIDTAAGQPTIVHALVAATASVTGDNYFDGTAEADLYGLSPAILANAYDCSNSPGCSSGSHHPIDSNITPAVLYSDTEYEIILHANEYDYGIGAGDWSISIDPTITLDPDYTAPAGATISFSDNLQTTAIPEPDSLALLLAAAGALVWLRRRA